MSNLEHYFENLLFNGLEYGETDPNRESLTKEQIEAVETCAVYVLYSLFYSHSRFLEFARCDIDTDIDPIEAIRIVKESKEKLK